jgi:hypothetical protein
MRGDGVVRSHLVEVPGPARPHGTMPESIFDCVEAVRARLSSAQTREAERRDQRAQEEREAASRR